MDAPTRGLAAALGVRVSPASNLRLIARLDVKAPHLIKTVHLEGVRKLGKPAEFARRYYQQGIDEIVYIDAVASLYQRNTIVELVRETARDVFIPITVGGGIRSVADVQTLLRAGADKVAINTAAIRRPELIREVAEEFGSQCMVLSVQAKRNDKSRWEAFCDLGRERTGLDAVAWAVHGAALGAGEILLTSIDQEGMRAGFDVELARAVTGAVRIPVIVSGGMGSYEHLRDVVRQGGADAVAMAYMLHYGETTVAALRTQLRADGIKVRAV